MHKLDEKSTLLIALALKNMLPHFPVGSLVEFPNPATTRIFANFNLRLCHLVLRSKSAVLATQEDTFLSITDYILKLFEIVTRQSAEHVERKILTADLLTSLIKCANSAIKHRDHGAISLLRAIFQLYTCASSSSTEKRILATCLSGLLLQC